MKGSFLILFNGILLLNWSFVQGLLEDIGVDREEDNGRSSHLEVLFLEKKKYDFYFLIGPVESKLYIGITIIVYELIKAGGSEMHWVGGGVKSKTSQVLCESICVNVVVFFIIAISVLLLFR